MQGLAIADTLAFPHVHLSILVFLFFLGNRKKTFLLLQRKRDFSLSLALHSPFLSLSQLLRLTETESPFSAAAAVDAASTAAEAAAAVLNCRTHPNTHHTATH